MPIDKSRGRGIVNLITARHSPTMDRRRERKRDTRQLHGSRDKKGMMWWRGWGIERTGWGGTIDTLRIPEGKSQGWVEGAITSGHPSVLHLPLTTFRANKSWFLSSLSLQPSLSPHFLPLSSLLLLHSSHPRYPSVSRPSVSPLYLFRCLPPHQPGTGYSSAHTSWIYASRWRNVGPAAPCIFPQSIEIIQA